MKKLLTIVTVSTLLGLFGVQNTTAQCPGCVIDQTCGVGISPVEPTLCPASLPNGTVGVYYDQNATFYMPREFTDSGSGAEVTLNSVTVTSVTGMPQGLSYQCDQPGCAYTITNDPATQRGCVKMCGTPTVPGTYNIVIQVVANVTTPIGTINQPTGFTLPLVIDPAPGGNCCFSYDPPSACGELDVQYDALLNFEPLQPTEYSWDFDNGNTGTGQNPGVESYTTTGDYYPELVTTVYNYVLTDVSVTASGSGWCGDVEEVSLFNVCQGAPDLFFNYSNNGVDYTSNWVGNNLTASWSNLGLELNSLVFSLQFWDDDDVSQNDNLGAIAFSVNSTGTFNFQNSEVFGTYTIGTVVDTIITTVDTVSVFPVPATPQIAFSPSQAVCVGDSILMEGPSGPYQYQWLNSGSFFSDSSAVWVSSTSYYSLLVIDTTYFCQAVSDSALVQVLQYPLPPVMTYNGLTGNLEITNNTGNYDITWYSDGVELQGETGDTLAGQTTSGPYTAMFSNAAGCTAVSSNDFWLCIPANVAALANDTLCCGDTVTFDASGFAVNPFSTIAWAITPEADGPVTSQQEATDAEAGGHILSQFGESIEFTRTCYSWADSVAEGNYYVTPFAIENPQVDPLTYDTLQGCAPYAEICPALNAADDNWELFPMVFTFPDGSQLNVNDAIAFGLPINQQLLDLAGGLPCLALTDLFTGDPNGVWTITATNTGTTALDMSVPDFLVINWADTCNLIQQDEVYQIEGVDVTLNPGQTQTISFNIPPLPSGFPSVNPECSAFGDPILITFSDCYPDLTNNLLVTGTAVNSTIVSGNGYIDVTISGGTSPYTIEWADGPTTEDRFNLTPGTYSITVTDAANFQAFGSWDIDGPYLGIDDDLNVYGFSLGQNVPNPTDGTTTIDFKTLERGNFDFVVKDAAGREITRMQIGASAGENRLVFDGSKLSSGLYTYSLMNGDKGITKRMVISK